LNLNTNDEKSVFANNEKQQQSADSNSGARTGGHELEKGLSPIVVVSKLTGQNTKPKDVVPTSFNRIYQHVSKVIGKNKKMVWVPKGSTPIKAELITRTSTARPTLKSEPCMSSKVLLSNIQTKRLILGVMIGHGALKDNHEVRRLQVNIRIIGDHIINSHHSMHHMDKAIHIQNIWCGVYYHLATRMLLAQQGTSFQLNREKLYVLEKLDIPV
jgi:hypothetical protein